MSIIPENIEKYCLNHTTDEDDLLKKINRETHLEVLYPRMLSGKWQGNFLKMISCMLKPQKILEIGTYTGYSAICLAAGLSENGLLFTIECNSELEDRIKNYFQLSPKCNQIKLLIGNALDVIPTLNHSFDLIFIDADKVNYLKYYQMVFDKLTAGGIILVDNVLWSGKVVEIDKYNDKDTKAIHEFNEYIQNDKRVENLLLPLRDGIMMIRKL
jgi:predicted O-methyltransferase YrrM